MGTHSQISKSFLNVINFLKKELDAVFGEIIIPGTIFIFISIFFFIIFSNFIGLMPYIFTRTSHLSITIAIRLAANMVAGHLLLTLLGSQGPIISIIILLILLIRLILLLILEVAVACIQSYVFTILRSLYLNELIRTNFNKKVLS